MGDQYQLLLFQGRKDQRKEGKEVITSGQLDFTVSAVHVRDEQPVLQKTLD
jgi:hypothetical protein